MKASERREARREFLILVLDKAGHDRRDQLGGQHFLLKAKGTSFGHLQNRACYDVILDVALTKRLLLSKLDT